MKKITCRQVSIPWYLKRLWVLDCKTRELKIGFYPVLEFYFSSLWYWFPRWLESYNMKDCVNFCPDYREKDGSIGNKVKPFFGMVFDIEEGAAIDKKWWKHIVFTKKGNNKHI